MAQKKLKVLCLHGFCENADHFKKKSMGLQDKLTCIDYYFVSAPHKYNNKKRTFMWWNSIDIDGNKKQYLGMIDSLYYIANIINLKGPFDGIIGFSQGGVLLSLILGLIEYPMYGIEKLNLNTNKWNLNKSTFKFAIMISSFIPRDVSVYPLYDDILNKKRNKIQIPILHICGKQEVFYGIVKKLLPKYFENFESIAHNGGHIIPFDDHTITAINLFLETFVFNAHSRIKSNL
eukprot:370018_1